MEAVAPPHWDDMSPCDKQAWLLDQALDRKREILAMPLPDESDDSAEATRLRALILAAADSTISQTIALRSNMLAMAQDNRDREIEAFIEERRLKAVAYVTPWLFFSLRHGSSRERDGFPVGLPVEAMAVSLIACESHGGEPD